MFIARWFFPAFSHFFLFQMCIFCRIKFHDFFFFPFSIYHSRCEGLFSTWQPSYLILIFQRRLLQSPVSSVAEHWSRKPGVGSSTLPQGCVRVRIGLEVIFYVCTFDLFFFFTCCNAMGVFFVCAPKSPFLGSTLSAPKL